MFRVDTSNAEFNDHRGLNYLFQVTNTKIIEDAATVGDPTRCMNDSRDLLKNNATAKCESGTAQATAHVQIALLGVIIDGDPKMLFYTSEFQDTLAYICSHEPSSKYQRRTRVATGLWDRLLGLPWK